MGARNAGENFGFASSRSFMTALLRHPNLTTILTGEATAAIRRLQVVGDTYGTTITMLKEHLRNPDTLIQFQFMQLLDVEAVWSPCNVPKLRHFHDMVQAHI